MVGRRRRRKAPNVGQQVEEEGRRKRRACTGGAEGPSLYATCKYAPEVVCSTFVLIGYLLCFIYGTVYS